MRTAKRLCAAAVLAATLGACELVEPNDGHPDVGGDTDDYRESPCACQDVPQRMKLQYVG